MLGFGEKKIDVQLSNFNFKPGDTIQGTVSLTVKKPAKAKGVFVRLYADQEQSGMRGKTITPNVFELKQQLDGEKEYSTGENPAVYPFKIKIPSDILSTQKLPEGKIGTALKAAAFLSGTMTVRKWYVEAKIDIPLSLDTKKRAQVNISE